jgi:hypothetical protein
MPPPTSPPSSPPSTPPPGGPPTSPPFLSPTPSVPTRPPRFDLEEEKTKPFGAQFLTEAEKEFSSQVATAEAVLTGDVGALGEEESFTGLSQDVTEPGRVAQVKTVGDVPETVERKVSELEAE